MRYFGDDVCAKRSRRGVFARPLPRTFLGLNSFISMSAALADGQCRVAQWHHLQLLRLQLPSFASANAAADSRGDVQGIVSSSCPSDKLNY